MPKKSSKKTPSPLPAPHPSPKIQLSVLAKSPFCRAVLLLSVVAGYFLVPKPLYSSNLLPLALLFIATFSLTITCIVFSAKERFLTIRSSGESILGAVGSLVGIVSIELCGISATSCSGGLALSAIGFLLPAGAIHLLSNFAVPLLALSIGAQLIYLFRNCRI